MMSENYQKIAQLTHQMNVLSLKFASKRIGRLLEAKKSLIREGSLDKNFFQDPLTVPEYTSCRVYCSSY